MEPVISNLKSGAHIAPFFVLNDDFREERIRQMIEECARAGFDAIILHPRPGLRIPYLSKAWFAAIAFCVTEARVQGLKVWLYDEYPWPSGAAGGRVIQRNPDFAEKHLSTHRYPVPGGAPVSQVLGPVPVLEAFLVPLERDGKTHWAGARVVTPSVGMRNTTWITRDWDSRFYYLPEHVQRYECRRAMEYLPEYVFEDDVPEGRWTLITFTVVTGSDFLEPFGHYVDLSNKEATAAFLDETHERYRQHFEELFGSQILGVFTDEPKYRNVLPWSNTISAEWTDYQQDPRALLGLLPDSEEGDLRKSYRELTTNLFSENWVNPVRDWCQNENLGFIGHISPEEDWWGECRFAGSILRHLRKFSTPGCDLIIPAAGDRAHPVLNFTPSLAASAAAQTGATQALCEVFGCSNYSLDMQTVKRVTDWLMLFGINFIVPHACFYSLAGPRRFDAPPTFLSPSTLEPFLAQWSAYVHATADRLGPNRPVDVAIVRPMSHLFTLSEDHRQEAVRLFDQALEVAQHLMEQGIAFHWVDDSDLQPSQFHKIQKNAGTHGPGTFTVGHATYRRLIGWSGLLPAEAAKNLRSHSLALLSPAEALTLRGPLSCPEGDVRVTRDTEGNWFCLNLSSDPRSFQIDGHEANLAGYESRWLETSVPQAVPPFRMPLGGEWQMRPPEENVFRLVEWTCNGTPRPVGPAYHSLMPKSAAVPTVYGPVPGTSGLTASRLLVFESGIHWEESRSPKALSLNFEEGAVEGAWEVYVNDSRLSDWQPRTDFFGGSVHDLTRHLQPGANRLRIEVTANDAREGLWLEPLIRGDFVVTPAGHLRAGPASVQGSDWSRCGYPHYSGSLDFEQVFHWEESCSGEEAWLIFETPPASMVEVLLNGEALGTLLWSPWRLRIQDALRTGQNRLCLRVTNTLHNFISGRAHPSGPLGGAEIQTLPVVPRAEARRLEQPQPTLEEILV